MFAPWRSQKSLRKHKDPITGNSFNRQHAQMTLLTDSEYISEFYIFDTYKRVIDRGLDRSIIVSRKKLRVNQGRSFGQSQSS